MMYKQPAYSCAAYELLHVKTVNLPDYMKSTIQNTNK